MSFMNSYFSESILLIRRTSCDFQLPSLSWIRTFPPGRSFPGPSMLFLRPISMYPIYPALFLRSNNSLKVLIILSASFFNSFGWMRQPGFAPGPLAWEARVLLLDYWRTTSILSLFDHLFILDILC